MTSVVNGERISRSGGRPNKADQPLVRLLLDSIDDDVRGTKPASAYPGIDPVSLSAATFIHKVAPAVYLHLRGDENVPAELLAPMRERYQLQVARQLLVAADLATVGRTLGDLGQPWVAIKGPVLAERLWARPDLRQYVDLDVLVDRRRFGDVLDALLAAGAEMTDLNWTLIAEQTRAEVSLKLPNGTALDLHWHVVNSAALREGFRFPIAEMLERAVQVKIGGTVVPTLDPADTLLHLAYHTAHSGGHRLMWLKDIERASADPGLDWGLTLRRARDYGVRLPLAVVLARTGRVLRFEVPPPAAALGPATRTAWGAFAAAVDRWRPAPILPSDKFSGQIAFKNARTTSLRSFAAATVAMRHRGGPGVDLDENVLHIDDGGPQARAAYLRVVEGGREP